MTLLLVAALLPAKVVAGEPVRPGPDDETLTELGDLFRHGKTARLRTIEGDRLVLSPTFSPEGVRVVDSDGVVTVTPWSEIQGIDARGGSPARGALVGSIVGAAGGIALGFVAALGDDGGDPVTTFLGSTAMSATAGAIAGAGVGSLFPGWVKVYPGRPRGGSSWGLQRRK